MSAQMQGVTRQRRAYHVHCARIEAEGQAYRRSKAAREIFEPFLDGHGNRFALSCAIALAVEWRGIAKACRREENRLARLKHGGAR